jgi:hypothetical protein
MGSEQDNFVTESDPSQRRWPEEAAPRAATNIVIQSET